MNVLRRIAANAVDVLHEGAYYRALDLGDAIRAVRVRQSSERSVTLETTARDAGAVTPVIRRMLGLDAPVPGWPERAAAVDWLAPLAERCRGLRPPRYPSLWEACAHAVIFQQISIYAAGSIMRRLVERYGSRVTVDGVDLRAFPAASTVAAETESALRAAGLSANKVAHLQAIAHALERGEISEAQIERLPTPEAAQRLTMLRGIGPWSAAVILLRGFGRLDTFPMNDSGVAVSIKRIAGTASVNVDGVLQELGPVRGFLYYHLLLGRNLDGALAD